MRPCSCALLLAAVACAGPAEPATRREGVEPPIAAFGHGAWCVADGPRRIVCERRVVPDAGPIARAHACTEIDEPVAELRIHAPRLLVRTVSGRVLEGDAPSSDGPLVLRPVPLPSPARAIGAGASSCALTEADGVLCWSDETGPPTRVAGLSTDVRELVVYLSTACAIEGGGRAACWGALGGEWLDNPRTVFTDAHSLAVGTDGYSVCAVVGARRRLFCFEALLPNQMNDHLPPPRELRFGVVDLGAEPIDRLLPQNGGVICLVTAGSLYCNRPEWPDDDPVFTEQPGTRLLPRMPIGPIFRRVRQLGSEARVVSVGNGVCVIEHGEVRCSTNPPGAMERLPALSAACATRHERSP